MKVRFDRVRKHLSHIPLTAWLLGALVAALVEAAIGPALAYTIGLSSIPPIFGLSRFIARPELIPAILFYLILVYVAPTYVVARLIASPVEKGMALLPEWSDVLLYLLILYAIIRIWGGLDGYRLLFLRLVGIGVILNTSLNLVNGWMGEFSLAHAGFAAVGAYVSSIIMVWGFVNDDVFGKAVFPTFLAPYVFPLVLIVGGIAAMISALVVAIPSFRTRGDYLGIITLAFIFIVQGAFNNMNSIGGARGFMGMPKLASLTWVFVWAVLCVVTIYFYVNSTYGKATAAVRDNESAAEVMTIDTRKVKTIAFLTDAFWSGIAGGLFAHVMGYINPGNFGIIMAVEVLAMLYLGGLNSITGSILGAVIYWLLSEMFRPLGLYKWVIIPVLLIIIMIYKPIGLLGFQEIGLSLHPSGRKGVGHAADTD